MSMKEIRSEITGFVWKIVKSAGDAVGEDDALMILESMKMEIPVTPEASGKIAEIRVRESEAVTQGQVLAVIEA